MTDPNDRSSAVKRQIVVGLIIGLVVGVVISALLDDWLWILPGVGIGLISGWVLNPGGNDKKDSDRGGPKRR